MLRSRVCRWAVALAAALGWSGVTLGVEPTKPTEPSRTCEKGPRGTLEVDAIELIRTGADVAGLAEHTAVHGAYTYRFKNAENKAAFEADPARYEIQLGGACARMGPLSGAGSPKLHAVHDGRIYIFASGLCKQAFTEDPMLYIDAPDARPVADAAAIEKGKSLLKRVLAAHGGEEAIRTTKSMRWTIAGDEEYKGEKVKTGMMLRIGFDPQDTVRMEEWWDKSALGSAMRGETGWLYDTRSIKTMQAQQREELHRISSRSLVAVLRAADEPDAIVAATAAPKGGGELDFVVVWRAGCSSVLGVDRNSGRVVMQRFRGRGPTLTIGDVEHRFGDFRTVTGVLVPFTIERRFNGQAWKSGNIAYAEIVANEPVVVEDLAKAK